MSHFLHPYSALTISERLENSSVCSSTPDMRISCVEERISRPDLFDYELLQQRLSVNEWNIEDYARVLDDESGSGTFNAQVMNAFLEEKIWEDSLVTDDPYGYFFRGFLAAAGESAKLALSQFQLDEENLEDILASLFRYLYQRLLSVSLKEFIVELDEMKTKGELAGQDEKERFTNFAKKFGATSNILSFYQSHPFLTRRLSTITTYFNAYLNEVCANVAGMWQEICHFAGLNASESFLASLEFGQGDTHNNGKTVAVLKIADSGKAVTRKIVYKPRVDAGVSIVEQVDTILAQSFAYKNLRFPKTLQGDGFSIVEYIEQSPCDTHEEVEEYFQKFGQLAGVCYALNVTDLHYENIIACGASPVPVDLETCFSAPFVYADQDLEMDITLMDKVRSSVLASMLLPVSIPINHKGDSLNLSAFDGDAQEFPIPQLVPVDLDTDCARFENQTVYVEEAHNKVRYNDDSVSPYEYQEHIVKGLRIALEAVLTYRTDIQKLIEADSNAINRILIRDTSRYARLLDYSYHPSVSSSALEAEYIFENLYAIDFANKGFVETEIRSLHNCDIPIFYASLSSTHIFDENMNDLGGVLLKTPIQACIEKLEHLDAKDIELQCAIAAAAMSGEDETSGIYPYAGETLGLELLDAISDDLHISNDDGISGWITLVENFDSVAPSTAPADFYDGLFGVALVYFEAYKRTNDEVFLSIGQRLVDSALKIPQIGIDSAYTGMFSGLQLFVAGYSEYLTDFARNILSESASNYQMPQSYSDFSSDPLNGHTGLISLFAKLSSTLLDDTFSIHAETLASFLINDMDNILSDTQTHGIGHGLPGIINAFTDLYAATGDEEYADKARYVCSYMQERKDFWENDISSWCHGMQGTILSMAKLDSVVGTDNKSVIEKMLERIEAINLKNDTVCHGETGLALMYLELAPLLEQDKYRDSARKHIENIAQRTSDIGGFSIRFLSGIPRIGLFTGLAGIAYATMNLEGNQHPPSILC